MKRIMITAAGGPAGFCLAKHLKGKAYLIGLDGSKDSPAQFFCDEMHLVPFASSPEYKEEMLAVIKTTSPDIIVPTFDEDLIFFNSIKSQLVCFVLLSPEETLHICNDKRKTAEVFPDIAAATYALEVQHKPSYPLYIRPAVGRGSKLGFKVESDADYEYAIRKIEEPIIQDFLPGPEVTVDTFADLQGNLLGIAPRIRAQTRGGISTIAKFLQDDQLQNACTVIHNRLKIVGPANIQFMKDSDRTWKLVEINPRYSGGLALSYAAGFDSITPILTIDTEHKTIRAEKVMPVFGVTVVRYWEERAVDD